MKEVLTKVRKLNWLLQECPTGRFSFAEMCRILSDLMVANVYVVNARGKVLGVCYKIIADSSTTKDMETGIEAFPKEYNEEFMKIDGTRMNISGDEMLKIFKYDYDTTDKLHTIIPIIGGGSRLGTLIVTRYEKEFNEEDILLGEYGAAIVGLEIQRRKTEEAEEEQRQMEVVLMAINTLSYSEIEAVKRIFEVLEGDEGMLVASKIADRSGITRSVIVNALRKLESAGVIESRSLGMKGTRIRILNPKFKEGLSEFIDA